MSIYKTDVDSDILKNELTQFLFFCKEENVSGPNDMYSLISKFDLKSTFPNIEIILRIFLTVPISNASGERSFSVLKRFKNYLRNSLSQEHLSEFSILNIENEELNSIDYDSIIHKFVSEKCQKKLI